LCELNSYIIESNKLHTGACPTHSEIFTRGHVIVPFVQLSVVIDLFPFVAGVTDRSTPPTRL